MLFIMLNCVNHSNQILNTWLVVYHAELLWFDSDMDLACFNCGYLSKKYLGCVCLNTCKNWLILALFMICPFLKS